jgi:lipoprotein-releasing system permease protein
MFRPLQFFIGLRYVWSRKWPRVPSFMSAASAGGIAVGVAALIVVLSVMNGLETEMRNRLLSLTSHITLTAGDTGMANWAEVAQSLRSDSEITGAAPFVTIEGMLSVGSRLLPAIVRGVVPEEELRYSGIADLVEEGDFATLMRDVHSVVIGRALALNLGVGVGDRINLLHARIVDGHPRPELVALSVAGIFSAGIADHDASLALVPMELASRLAGIGTNAQSIGIRVAAPLEVARVRQRIAADATLRGLSYSDWTIEHRSHFRAIRIEKTMMSVMLLLIVGVAAFNIVASLMMVVSDKVRDIAILRTCGLEPGRVVGIFVFQGSIIGVVGTVVGAALGVLLALNIETLVPWLESTFGFKIMPGDVYYVTEIPSELHSFDVLLICVVALLIAVGATVHPSRRAGKIAPAEALRYD